MCSALCQLFIILGNSKHHLPGVAVGHLFCHGARFIGAGANARASLGISVFSGMIASTCLAVLFVPSFFVVLQRIEERWKPRKGASAAPTPARSS